VAPSTDAASVAAGVERAFPLARLRDEDIAALLRVPSSQAGAERKRIENQHADPVWIDSTLDALPVPCLVVLAALAERRGICRAWELEDHGQALGMSPELVQRAVVVATSKLLVVPLAAPGGEEVVALMSPSSALVAARVRDLDLTELVAADFVADDDAAPRELAALSGALAQIDVKATSELRPNRGQLKRLAAAVGIEVDRAEQLLNLAISVGLVADRDGVLRADTPAMLAAAAGRFPTDPGLEELARVAAAPLSFDAAGRILLRQRIHRGGLVSADLAAMVPGFVRGRVGQVPALVARPSQGSAAGHVTPSFEVFVPPEVALHDLIGVGACAELTRLDRVMTFRVTKASVVRAAAAGIDAAGVLARLSAVSKHPVPQNVEVAIRDWSDVTVARTAFGQVVVVDPAAADRVALALAGFEGQQLSPGVFVLDEDCLPSKVQQALARAGVVSRTDGDGGPVVAPALARTPATRSGPSVPDAVVRRLRARYAAWRRGERTDGDRLALDQWPTLAEQRDPVEDVLDQWCDDHDVELEPDGDLDTGLRMAFELLPFDQVEEMLRRYHDLPALVGVVREIVRTRVRPAARRRAHLELLPDLGPRRGATTAVPARAAASARPGGGSGADPDGWHRIGIQRFLEQAVGGEPIAVELRSGRTARVLPIELTRRGQVVLLLGEDLDSDTTVALRLDEIAAAGPASLLAPATWRPAPGQKAPPGHAPCPCGSGQRYRNCCRGPI
jgi:hypothetical protein